MTHRISLLAAGLFVAMGITAGNAAHGVPPDSPVWTDQSDPTLPENFHSQGQYVGEVGGEKMAAQVIALGNGAFQAVLLPGGLPGHGWDGEHKILLDGTLEDGAITFQPAQPPKEYLAQEPEKFSATTEFPPAGQEAWTGTISRNRFTGQTHDGKEFSLTKTETESPTLGAAPPADALVLFDGSDKSEWDGGRLDEQTGNLHTDGEDIHSKRKFNDYTLHLEFKLPFRPEARGQKRANSGVYQVDHYEVQVLDSFGLAGLDNECGGVYKVARPNVNMCAPPLTWQTYDIDFTNARTNDSGETVKPATITMRHNGVVIHENLELPGATGGARQEPVGTPGPIRLQGHGNPLQYRNIWIVEKKKSD